MNLVTGASGIVGSHIVLELLKAGEPVRIFKRSHTDLSALTKLLAYHGLNPTFETALGDVTDPVSIQEAILGCSAVYHCAALVSFKPADHQRLFDTNVFGTANITHACLANQVKLAYISSTAAIGDAEINDIRNEESIWTTDKGKSAYSISKRYAEYEVFRAVEEGLRAIIVNPSVIIGPGKWGESSTSIFLSGIKGMRFYPTGSNSFVDVRDVAEITIALLKKSNVNGRHLLVGENATFKTFFTIAADIGNASKPSIVLPKQLVAPVISCLKTLEKTGITLGRITSENLKSAYRKSTFSNEKVKALGFKFRTLTDALQYTFRVYRAVS